MVWTVSTQLNAVIISLFSGVITGVLFDIYRLIRGLENPNKIVTGIEDLLFWILTALVIFLFLIKYRCTYITLYVYMFIFLGFFIYINTVSKFFILIIASLFKFISKITRVFFNFIFFPLRCLINKQKK